MRSQIIRELNRVESKLDIKILYAVESGSRAWGFASTDSDWDVRFLYIHDVSWYLSIDNESDNYEEILDNGIDLAGWEIRKALRLFRKSNPPLLEWLRSPFVYVDNYRFAEDLRKLSEIYFSPRSCIFHYLSMAKGNFKEYLQSDLVRTKKYFYVLRPLLACKWIEINGSMAPMEFEKLLIHLPENEKLNQAVTLLLDNKKQGVEMDEGPRIEIINQFIGEQIEYFEKYVKSIQKSPGHRQDELNTLFRKLLNSETS